MAKVTAPFFSQKASGSFADTLTIQCGSVMKRHIMDKTDPPEWADLNFQQKLFSQAAKIWKTVLTVDQKKEWRKAEIVAFIKPVCLFIPASMIAVGILNPAAGLVFTTRELAVALGLLYLKNAYELTGYQLWMSVYLVMKGEHWVNYPLPPPETWNPF